MSSFDELTALRGLDGPVAPRIEFANDLLSKCLDELVAPQATRLARNGRLAIVLAAVFAILLLASIATATYLALRGSSTKPAPRPAQLTVIDQPSARMTALARVAVVEPGRQLRSVWQCPEHTWCGILTAVGWSPDGRRLALTLGEIGGRSGYVGLHVIDLASGADRQLGAPAIPHLVREQPTSVLDRVVSGQIRALGCPLPHELAWSADSNRLAYVCGDDLLHGGERTSIYVIRADGKGRTRLRTGTSSAYWPTWSPDGSRIAFATEPGPRISYRHDTTMPVEHRRSNVYAVHLDGSGRTLVARDASAPAWSPDGGTIAVAAPCGVRRVTVAGSPVGTCLALHGRGLPAWSPDGSQLALATDAGVEVVGADGGTPTRVTPTNGAGLYGVGRPAWAPTTALSLLFSKRHRSGV